MKILVVEDEIHARERIKDLLSQAQDISWIGEATNGPEALTAINTKKPDLVFLDINIPAPGGIELIKTIKHKPLIVFITAYDEFAIQAFEQHAIDYILKPYTDERFYKSLNYARTKFSSKNSPNLDEIYGALSEKLTPSPSRINIKENGKIFIIHTDSIMWVESSENGCDIKTEKKVFHLKKTLLSLEEAFSHQDLIRVHRSTIVNINFIDHLKHWNKGEYLITMRDQKLFTSSRTYRANLENLVKTI